MTSTSVMGCDSKHVTCCGLLRTAYLHYQQLLLLLRINTYCDKIPWLTHLFVVDVNRHCSRFVHPHRNDFLIVVVVIWCGEAISMIFMIITTLKKYMQTIRTNSEPISLTSVPHNSVPSAIANDAPSQGYTICSA